MSVNGLVTSVQWVAQGSELTAAALTGDTTLEVESTVDFDDAGGDLEINGVRYEYGSCDENASTVELVTALVADAAEDDRVFVVAGGQVAIDYMAFVTMGEGDDAEVEIPFSQRPLWPEGVYEDPVPVLLSDNLEAIESVPGRTPIIDGVTFQTATEGARTVIRDDGDGGVFEMYSGATQETTPAMIDPSVSWGGDTPALTIRSGSSVAYPNPAGILLTPRDVGGATYGYVNIQSDFTILTGDGEVQGNLNVSGDGVTVGSLHGGDVYVDSVPTSVSAANCRMNDDGRLVQSTSLRKNKADIRDIAFDPDAVLALRPRQWESKCAGEEGKHGFGFVAEEVAALVPELCAYDDAGNLTGVDYERLAVALVPVVRAQAEQIQALEARMLAAESGFVAVKKSTPKGSR